MDPELPGRVLWWGLPGGRGSCSAHRDGACPCRQQCRVPATSQSPRGQWRHERAGERVVPTGSASSRWVCATQRPRPGCRWGRFTRMNKSKASVLAPENSLGRGSSGSRARPRRGGGALLSCPGGSTAPAQGWAGEPGPAGTLSDPYPADGGAPPPAPTCRSHSTAGKAGAARREGGRALQGVPAELAALQAGHNDGVLVTSENHEALKPTRTGSAAQASQSS